jgi:exopolysaccharide biosynthesis polyprenyl glycosylphosphotransferase
MKEDAVALSCPGEDCAAPAPELYIPADLGRFYGLQGWCKRVLDVALAGLLLVISAPLLLVIALLIKRSSPGPVFFVQERLGRDGRPFKFYKFRTMRHDSDDAIHRQFAAMFINGLNEDCARQNCNQQIFKMKDDPRVTGIGRLLRRTSLDELPQIFNILKGEMSLVGPRPPIAYEIEHYQSWHMERLKVTPGLTGLWQVSGRSSVPFEEMVRLDIHYINNWSLWMDLRILMRTLPVVLNGTGGY